MNSTIVYITLCVCMCSHQYVHSMNKKKIIPKKNISPKNSPHHSPRIIMSSKERKLKSSEKSKTILTNNPLLKAIHERVPFTPKEVIQFNEIIEERVFTMIGSIPFDAIDESDDHPSLDVPTATENRIFPLIVDFNQRIKTPQPSLALDIYNHILALRIINAFLTPEFASILIQSPRKLSASFPLYKKNTTVQAKALIKETEIQYLRTLKESVLKEPALDDSLSL